MLLKFNPFKQQSSYDVIDEMQHEHEFHIHELDSLMHGVKHNYMTLKNKKDKIHYIKTNPEYDTTKLIVFDTIRLPLPVNETIRKTIELIDTIKTTCYDTIWLRDTLKLISKPKLFGKYETDTIKH
tara:strand:+ start:1676 stop:2053 length:378 start_codon:yes stop_codon:yes gene_type:complete